MVSPLRKFLESVVYAGLKPATPGKPTEHGKLRKLWDRVLLGTAPVDPLYLSNRTWKQKLRFGLIIGSPLAIVIGIVIYALFTPPPVVERPLSDLPPEEIAARTQIIPKDFTVTQNTDLQIVEVAVDKSTTPNSVTGTLKNNTGRFYSAAELTFDLTDEEGSAVGGVSTKVLKVEPHSVTSFRFSIPQRNAAFVLVREARGTF
jgi:hypothetical protein